MEIREIKNKNLWEDFLLDCEEKTFLQSWNWGEFNKIIGNSAQGGSAPGGKIWRLGVYDSGQLIATAFFYKIAAKRGTFLFVPHAPSVVLAKEGGPKVKYEIVKILIEELKKVVKEEKCDFIRIAPILELTEENMKIFRELDFKEAPIHIHPELTWELDIMPSEEELLAKMRKTTRYLIRQAQKNSEVKINSSIDINDVDKFDTLNQKTVGRHHFTPFSLSYLKNEFSAFTPDGQISIFLGRYKNELVSSGIFVFWQGIGFYHHGASSLRYSKIPVSYLLLWEAIKEAKNRGCKKFNFWGIAPENEKNHPWAGLTLFKMGFGGYKKEYLKTQDFPLSSKYYLTYLFEKIRKIKRGL
jgi:lipid II:glycine glycyltransferase (peptidoglycan interpeptide bridge formation enzyme)